MPGLFCSGMGAPLCRSRMDSHCTDRRGVQRGKAPLALGHPIGASNIPVGKGGLEGNGVPLGGRFPKEGSAFLGTRLSFGKSGVLYLCFRLTLERGWLRHLLCVNKIQKRGLQKAIEESLLSATALNLKRLVKAV